jgi:hypothetical protein
MDGIMGVPEIVILIVIGILIFGIVYIFKGVRRTTSKKGVNRRRCLACGYEGEMKTWLLNNSATVRCLAWFTVLLYTRADIYHSIMG